MANEAAAAEFILLMLALLGAVVVLGALIGLIWGAISLIAYRLRSRPIADEWNWPHGYY